MQLIIAGRRVRQVQRDQSTVVDVVTDHGGKTAEEPDPCFAGSGSGLIDKPDEHFSTLRQQSDDGLCVNWPAEVIALDLVAMAITQEGKLLVGLHAFGDHFHVQPLSE